MFLYADSYSDNPSWDWMIAFQVLYGTGVVVSFIAGLAIMSDNRTGSDAYKNGARVSLLCAFWPLMVAFQAGKGLVYLVKAAL